MPKYQKTRGYDPLTYYTRLELRKIYKDMGYSNKEAIQMARDLYWEIRKINDREAYSWNKARELESPYGAGAALRRLGARFGDNGGVWIEIESKAKPNERETAHYERLRGKRIRIKGQKERGSTGNPRGSQADEEPGEPVPTEGPEGN